MVIKLLPDNKPHLHVVLNSFGNWFKYTSLKLVLAIQTVHM